MSMGGGGSRQVATQTQVSDVPEWAKPYYTQMLDVTQQELFNKTVGPDGTTSFSLKPYEAYGGPRLATSSQFGDIGAAQDITRGLAAAGTPMLTEAAGLSRNITSGARGIMSQAPAQFSEFGGFRAGQASPFAGFRATEVSPYTGYRMAQATPFTDFSEAGFNEFQFGPAGQFSGQAAADYMDPYMQNVVDIQKRQAQEDYDIARGARNARAVAAGAFGGSRQGVQEGMAERDLLTRQGEIQARGLSTAYADAQRMFGEDRAARMAVEQARAAEAARVQGGVAGEAARVQGSRAAELARVQAMTQNEFARVQAGQAAELARTQGISVAEAARIQQAQAAELARVQGISIDEAARVQAAQAAEAARVQGARAAEGIARGQLGLGALGLQAQQAAQLAAIGEQQRAAQIQNAQMLEAIGRAQQAEAQAGLDIGYQDFLRQQGYPIEQLGQYSAILRGLPVGDTGTTQTLQPYNPTQQALGAGLSALSLYKAFA